MLQKTKNKLGAVLLSIFMGAFASYSTSVVAAPYFATTSDATAAAIKIGYAKTKLLSSGQAVYEKTATSKVKSLTFISPDVDSHNGGAWKAASSVANLGSKATRLGTYSVDLSVRMGD